MGEASRRRMAAAHSPNDGKSDRLAALVVASAADAFARSIREGSALLAVFEATGFDPGLFDGSGLVAFLPGVDDRGRTPSLTKRKSGRHPLKHRYEWRTRALARLTSDERRKFVASVRAHPGASPTLVSETRAAFASAMRDARARDEIAETAARAGGVGYV